MNASGGIELTIVIVNYRSWDRLSRCLASLGPLIAGAGPPSEIVVVDNASGDGRLDEFARAHAGVRFVANDGNWGFADGCNRGAQEARGRLLLFFNPDAEDPGGQVAALVAAARSHPGSAIFTARQVDENGRAQKVFDTFPSLGTLFGPVRATLRLVAPGRYPDPRGKYPPYREVDWVSGSVQLVRREVFEAAGGFCNGFWMYSEDVDLCRRVRDAGHGVAVVGTVTLLHAHGGASRKDPVTAALTKSEVVVSRHYYASRHFGRLHAAAYHVALMATRFLPVAFSGVGRHLARYYRRVPASGWRSLRSRP
jgi:GT2 family glycosyltransferase